MPKIALFVAFSLALSAPLAAQNRGESGDRGERPDAVVVVPATVTVSPRPRPAPSVTRTKQSFTLPWFTGVYQ